MKGSTVSCNEGSRYGVEPTNDRCNWVLPLLAEQSKDQARGAGARGGWRQALSGDVDGEA